MCLDISLNNTFSFSMHVHNFVFSFVCFMLKLDSWANYSSVAHVGYSGHKSQSLYISMVGGSRRFQVHYSNLGNSTFYYTCHLTDSAKSNICLKHTSLKYPRFSRTTCFLHCISFSKRFDTPHFYIATQAQMSVQQSTNKARAFFTMGFSPCQFLFILFFHVLGVTSCRLGGALKRTCINQLNKIKENQE